MALKNIPVLHEEYPLFDWSPWQSSYDALVPGVPTKRFAKEAWNAIIDCISEALEAAGEQWDSTYTTAEGAKITVAYGRLTAQKFNSVRHNIDRPAPLGWAWAKYPDFRGYVGREDFQGRSETGRAGDKVYPEYIIELARKLNLLLELMRGTGLIEETDAQHISPLLIEVEAFAGKAAHADTSHLCSLHTSVDMKSGRAGYTEAEHKSRVYVSADMEKSPAASGSVRLKIPVPILADGQSKPGTGVEPEHLLMGTKVNAEVEANRYAPVTSEHISSSLAQAEGHTAPPVPVEPDNVPLKSTIQAEGLLREPIHGEARILTSTKSVSEMDQKPPRAAVSRVNTHSKTEATLEYIAPVFTEGQQQSACRVSCELDTAWLPPIWVNGGLWIRQVNNEPVQYENGELEVC